MPSSEVESGDENLNGADPASKQRDRRLESVNILKSLRPSEENSNQGFTGL